MQQALSSLALDVDLLGGTDSLIETDQVVDFGDGISQFDQYQSEVELWWIEMEATFNGWWIAVGMIELVGEDQQGSNGFGLEKF